MTTLILRPTLATKTIEADGVVAVGEQIKLQILGVKEAEVSGLRARFRIDKKEVALFPLTSDDEWEFTNAGAFATLTFNTTELKACFEDVADLASLSAVVFLEDANDCNSLYAAGSIKVNNWPGREGESTPTSPEDWKEQAVNKTFEEIRTKAQSLSEGPYKNAAELIEGLNTVVSFLKNIALGILLVPLLALGVQTNTTSNVLYLPFETPVITAQHEGTNIISVSTTERIAEMITDATNTFIHVEQDPIAAPLANQAKARADAAYVLAEAAVQYDEKGYLCVSNSLGKAVVSERSATFTMGNNKTELFTSQSVGGLRFTTEGENRSITTLDALKILVFKNGKSLSLFYPEPQYEWSIRTIATEENTIQCDGSSTMTGNLKLAEQGITFQGVGVTTNYILRVEFEGGNPNFNLYEVVR